MFKIKTSDGWKEIHDASKQDKLVGTETTGQNIKTINGETILGTGDLTISGEPAEYIKDITQASNVYTATKKDGTSTVSWTIPDISGKADTTTVEGIATRVGTLETDMTGKAAQSDLTALTTRVGTNETNITSLQTNKADTTALDSYILKTAVDGTTITFTDNKLSAILPKSMVYKGSLEYVSELPAAETASVGDTYFVEKDDRSAEKPEAPIINALVVKADDGNWTYGGSTDIDLKDYAKQADLDTLDGKVSTLDGTVSTLDTTVSTHTTEIAGKAEQTDLNTTNENLGQLKNDLDGHIGDEDVHLQSGERDTWNGKQDAITGDNKLDADLLKEGATNKLVTETDKTKWNGYETGKQNTLSTERLAACDSGITSTLVGQIGTNQTNIQAINDSEVMKSGITSTKVSTYDGYATTIAGKQKQIYYGETEPTGSADGDVWVF